MSKGNVIDFDEHFRDQYPRLVNELNFILGDFGLAQDVAQDAFARLYVSWRRVSQLDKPGAWVRRVALRMATRVRTRLFRFARLDEGSVVTAVPAENSDRVLDVRRAVLQLTKAQRAAVVLHYYRDFTVAEVAQMLGCSENTAKVHLHNARKKLAELLVQYAPEESS